MDSRAYLDIEIKNLLGQNKPNINFGQYSANPYFYGSGKCCELCNGSGCEDCPFCGSGIARVDKWHQFRKCAKEKGLNYDSYEASTKYRSLKNQKKLDAYLNDCNQSVPIIPPSVSLVQPSNQVPLNVLSPYVNINEILGLNPNDFSIVNNKILSHKEKLALIELKHAQREASKISLPELEDASFFEEEPLEVKQSQRDIVNEINEIINLAESSDYNMTQDIRNAVQESLQILRNIEQRYPEVIFKKISQENAEPLKEAVYNSYKECLASTHNRKACEHLTKRYLQAKLNRINVSSQYSNYFDCIDGEKKRGITTGLREICSPFTKKKKGTKYVHSDAQKKKAELYRKAVQRKTKALLKTHPHMSYKDRQKLARTQIKMTRKR